MRIAATLVVLVLAGAAVFATVGGAARSDNPILTAVVGTNDGFDISLKDETGAAVRHLDPGTYTVLVHDRSALHNFHLIGPGMDKATSVFAVADVTWTVTLADGYYRFACDPHPEMKGDFTVGTGKRPPIALKSTVTAGQIPGLRDANDVRVAKLAAGRYVLTVVDRSKTDNFHLSGPGFDRATGLKFRGTVRWPLTLQQGTYRYWSDSHPKTRRALKVVAETG